MPGCNVITAKAMHQYSILKHFRNSLFARVFWGLVAIYLLNCSVDAPDAQLSHISDTAGFNDQESIIEILVEKVFSFEDAIAEYDDDDNEENMPVKKSMATDYFITPETGRNFLSIRLLKKQVSGYCSRDAAPPQFEIHSPPPEV